MQSIRIARGTCLDQTDPAADVDRAERVIRVLDAHAGLFQKEGDAHPVLDNAVPDELDECGMSATVRLFGTECVETHGFPQIFIIGTWT